MTATPTPEQLWDQIVQQLRRQMTRATFDTWIKETMLLSCEAGDWQIGVKSTFAKEWLENRLKETIVKTVFYLTGQAVRLEFVVVQEVGEAILNPTVISPAEPLNGSYRAVSDGHSLATEERAVTLPSPLDAEQRGSGLALDIRRLNRTGYQPLTKLSI